MHEAMRRYFLDESLDLPEAFRLYFWPCASKWQAILRGAYISRFTGSQPRVNVIGDFLKYFPVAFWLTYEAPSLAVVGRRVDEIPVHGHAIGDTVKLTLSTDITRAQRSDWPERVEDDEFLALDGSACYMAQEA